MTVLDFIEYLDRNTCIRVFDVNDELAYSDFLDDQNLVEVENEEIGTIVGAENNGIDIYLKDYTIPARLKCEVGEIWWTDLTPALGDEIGFSACEILETKVGGLDLVKVKPLRVKDYQSETTRENFVESIVGYVTTVSTERLRNRVLVAD
jgi:hypothetical protein